MASWPSSSSPQPTWAKQLGAALAKMGPVVWWATPSRAFHWTVFSSRWWAMRLELSGCRPRFPRSFSLQSLSRREGRAPKSFLSTMTSQSLLTMETRNHGWWITWCNEGYFLSLTICVIFCDIEGGFLSGSPLMILLSIFWDIEAFHTIPFRVIGVEGHLTMGVPK